MPPDSLAETGEPLPLQTLHPVANVEQYPVQLLKGKRVALGLTGSIAAVKGVELSRELTRHGAQVMALMSPPATRIIGVQSMEFATGRPPITEIGGQVEHVTMARPGGCDCYLIAPCTATTLGRIAHGLGDTPVALAALSLLGTPTPVLLAPAMDGAMAANPAVRENLARVKSLGCTIIPPVGEEGKAKLAEVATCVAHVLRAAGPGDWAGRKTLVVAGSSAEPLDGVRVISNSSSGRTGIALAEALFARGADVELWYGESPAPVPFHLGPLTRRFSSVAEPVAWAKEAVAAATQSAAGSKAMERRCWDWAFVPAALADFVIEGADTKAKLDSRAAPPEVKLSPAPRLLEALRPAVAKLVGFKLELGVTKEELLAQAQSRLTPEGPCDYVVANLAEETVGREEARAYLLGLAGAEAELVGPKMAVAHGLLEAVGG